MNDVRRMSGVVLWGFGALCILTESAARALFSSSHLAVQAPVALTVYLALCRPYYQGLGVLALLLPLVMAISGGPPGFYSLGLVATFFGAKLIGLWLSNRWSFGHNVAGVALGGFHFWALAAIDTVWLKAGVGHAIIDSMFSGLWTVGVGVIAFGYGLDYLDQRFGISVR